MKRFALLCILFFAFFIVVSPLRADQLDDISKQLDDLKKTFNELSTANQTNETQLQNLQKQLDGIKSKVFILEGQIETKQAQVVEGEKAFTTQQKLLNQRAKSYYKNMGKNSFSMVNLLLSDNISQSLQNYFYQKTLVDEDRKAIIRIAIFIKQVEDKKKQLETERQQLAVVKTDIDKQSAFLAGEVSKSKKYLGELQGQIAALVAQQQSIIAGRLSSLNISRSANSAGRCDSDLTNGRDPGFSPRFALFTYGVPNRIGLNQYGAKGRADRGENSEENILRAYYNFDNIEPKSNVQIRVDGYETYDLEVYLKGLHEMPASFPPAALRAQAIAARSYALAYTNNGSGSICATENCQVFSPPGDRNDAWTQAVSDTNGKVMIKGGSPIKAWFSSTHGGYIFNSAEIGWSGTDWTKHSNDFSGSVNSFDDLKNNAYDKESPWFYCDWGSRSEYNKTAWLKGDEMADIINVAMLALKDGGTIGNLYQTDKSNPAGKETWDSNRVKSELKNRGINPFNSIDSISVGADFGFGRTTSITVSGDAGSKTFDNANDFKTYFNQRAPANIQIVGPLFNVEKR